MAGIYFREKQIKILPTFFRITFGKNGNLVTVSLLPFLLHFGTARAPFDYSLQEWKFLKLTHIGAIMMGFRTLR